MKSVPTTILDWRKQIVVESIMRHYPAGIAEATAVARSQAEREVDELVEEVKRAFASSSGPEAPR